MLELFILYAMISFIPFGTVLTFLHIFGTGLFGAALVRYQGKRCWTEFHRQLECGEIPTQSITNGILILLAGALLMTPGLITDLMGILLLLPLVRRMVFGYSLYRFESHRLKTRRHTPTPPSNEIIDV